MDIRDLVFQHIKKKKIRAAITAMEDGVLCGVKKAEEKAEEIVLEFKAHKKDGDSIKKGDVILTIEGTPKKITLAEEKIIGCFCKTSGIATAARRAKCLGGHRLKIVCGAWKKMPPPIKEDLRAAISVGGVHYRISDLPFLYLDKNYVKIFKGVSEALKSVKRIEGRCKVIQLKSKGKILIKEALNAAREGADIIMIDTGRKRDITAVNEALIKNDLRERIKLAFGGGVKLRDIKELKMMNLDIIDIGREIVDAPLLDMRLDVTSQKRRSKKLYFNH